MYGGFWMSFGTIFIPGSGILTAYTEASELNSALGIYLWTWFIITFLLLCVSPFFLPVVVVAFGALDGIVALWRGDSRPFAAPRFSLEAGRNLAPYLWV